MYTSATTKLSEPFWCVLEVHTHYDLVVSANPFVSHAWNAQFAFECVGRLSISIWASDCTDLALASLDVDLSSRMAYPSAQIYGKSMLNRVHVGFCIGITKTHKIVIFLILSLRVGSPKHIEAIHS